MKPCLCHQKKSDIFISFHSCWRYLKISFRLISTSRLWWLLLLDLAVECVKIYYYTTIYLYSNIIGLFGSPKSFEALKISLGGMGFIRGPQHKTLIGLRKKIFQSTGAWHKATPAVTSCFRLPPSYCLREARVSTWNPVLKRGHTMAERSLQGRPMSNDEEQLVC